jgi:hypothetical protein
VDLYIRSPIRLHGVVLNKSSTGKTLLNLLLLVDKEVIATFNSTEFFNIHDYIYGSVGIATGYEGDDQGFGFRVPMGKNFHSPCRPDRLWGPTSLLSNRYRGSFPGGKAAGA